MIKMREQNVDFSLKQASEIGKRIDSELHHMSRSERYQMYRRAYFNPKNAL